MRKILLVEDEEFISLSESRLLKKHGFSVLCASSGEEAVRMFHEDPEIDLVLMDIDLGRGMDGTEAAKLMLKEREVPVVFLSSHTKVEIVARTEEIGSYGFIVKSSGDAVILASICVAFRLFDAKRAFDEQAQKLQAMNEELHSTLEELQATNEEYEAVNEGLLRAQEEILEREEELKILQSVSMLLASSDDLIDAFDSIMNIILQIAPFDCGGMYTCDMETGSIDLVVHRGLSQDFISVVSHYESDSPNAKVIAEGKPLYVLYEDIMCIRDDVRMKEGLRAIAILPVMHMSKPVAVINAASRSHDQIPQKARTILEEIALQIGSALFRLQMQEKMKKYESRFRGLFGTMNEGVCLHELVYDETGRAVDYKILEVNPKYEEFTGIPAHRAVRSLASQLYGTGEPPFLSEYAQVVESGKSLIFETYFPPMDRYYRISVFSPQKGQFATVFDDITLRVKMQKELSDAIDEKNALLRELQHRVKNSFATIASMISMELDRNLPPEASELLKNLQARMITMAELYGLLYEKGISNEVNAETFIRRIVGFLADAYLPIDGRITIHTSIEDFPLQVKIASSLGIIINELFINAIKHAFPNGRKGTICIEIAREGDKGKLIIRDDGIGVPENFSTKDVAMHGFQLVLLLVRQIQGNIDITRKTGGLELVLDFPVAQ